MRVGGDGMRGDSGGHALLAPAFPDEGEALHLAGRSAREAGRRCPHPRSMPRRGMGSRLPASRWERRTVSEGTPGPIAEAFARHRVPL